MERIADTKRLAAAQGREIQVWTPVGVVCRPTQREADEWVEYCVEHADLDAMGRMGRHSDIPLGQRVIGRGNYCAIGDPDTVVEALAWVHNAGFDGIVLHFVNYLDELPYFAQEVLPRLARRGLRTPAPVAVAS